MFLLRRLRPTDSQRSDKIILDAEESIRRAEVVTHAQEHLTNLASERRFDDYIQYATGVYPADIAADRMIRERRHGMV